MPTKDINDAAKPIKDAWDNIRNDYAQAQPGKYLIITCAYRSPDEQNALFAQGRTLGSDGKWYVQDKAKIVTNIDGKSLLGAHNFKPARAIDVLVVDNQTGKQTWDEKFYYPLVEIAARYGLESGGSWKSLKDWPHIQVKDYKNYVEA